MFGKTGHLSTLFRRKRRFLRASVGEVYTTLTGLPLRHRTTGPEGISIVECTHRSSRSGVPS